jgi:hypothetical protein
VESELFILYFVFAHNTRTILDNSLHEPNHNLHIVKGDIFLSGEGLSDQGTDPQVLEGFLLQVGIVIDHVGHCPDSVLSDLIQSPDSMG